MKVRDIMTRRPITVTAEATLRDVVHLLLRFHMNDVLVVDQGERLLGIITYKDIFRRLLPEYGDAIDDERYLMNPEAVEERLVDISTMPAKEFMTTDLHAVSPDTYVMRAGSLMNAYRVKQMPVVEDGRVIGVVSYRDIIWGLLSKYGRKL